MLSIITEGNHYQRGLQQGIACKDMVLERTEKTIESLFNLYDKSYLNSTVKKLRKRLEKNSPEIYEEICGIIDGLDIKEEEYFVSLFEAQLIREIPQCTTIGFLDNNLKPLLGKTDDIKEYEIGNNILEITYPKEGYKHVHIHFGGTVWTTSGMNEHGLSIAMTGIPGPNLDTDGLDSLDAIHLILPYCRYASEVKEYLEKININFYGFSLLIGDAKGELILLEKTGMGLLELAYNVSSFLLHTNFIIDSAFAAKNPSQKEPVLSNSIRRYKNLLKLVPDIKKDKNGLYSVLTDRNPDGPILQKGEDGLYTDYMVIISPVDGEFKCFYGYPEYKNSYSIGVDELLTSR